MENNTNKSHDDVYDMVIKGLSDNRGDSHRWTHNNPCQPPHVPRNV